MNAPKFYDVRLSGGPLVLCNACVAVLVQEGTVAGDPREEAVPASGVVRMAPRVVMPSDVAPTCDTCSNREAYEEALNASRAAMPSVADLTAADEADPSPHWSEAHFTSCEDVAFGTPEEHARWHAVHDTPTLREVEGEDGPPPRWDGDDARCPACPEEGYCPTHKAAFDRYIAETPF